MDYINIFEKNQNDGWTLVKSTKIEKPSNEQLIAEKEAKLLEMYDEIQTLKNKQN
jgi:hypothetical protein